ncbi:MAG: branched-chain amino acid ABC transporter permease [Hyphomonadaceae bacterium]|jgi:branched-chain amino acid transport system permease protein|nr:branched-chain amino acid ABC transporter permease [Hyphomonadaceae bacterium]
MNETMTMAAASAAPTQRAAGARRAQLPILALVCAVTALLPLVMQDVYLQNVLILTLMYAALSQSWNILAGYCGQISLGHALYFGVGAYAASFLFAGYGITPWLGLLVGAVLSAGLALVLGYVCFGLKGHYFAIATMVIAEIGLLLVHNSELFGAALGIHWPLGADSWSSMQFARTKLPYIYLALALFVLTWLATYAIEGSRWGFWWRAIKDDPEAAESLGVEVFRSKMAAAAVSAFFTAAGGAFYAAYVAYVDPESVMSFRFSLLFALPAVLGGIGTLWGPAVGALILIPITELTRSYVGGSGSGLDLIIYGGLIMIVALVKPEGLLSLVRPGGAKA